MAKNYTALLVAHKGSDREVLLCTSDYQEARTKWHAIKEDPPEAYQVIVWIDSKHGRYRRFKVVPKVVRERNAASRAWDQTKFELTQARRALDLAKADFDDADRVAGLVRGTDAEEEKVKEAKDAAEVLESAEKAVSDAEAAERKAKAALDAFAAKPEEDDSDDGDDEDSTAEVTVRKRGRPRKEG